MEITMRVNHLFEELSVTQMLAQSQLAITDAIIQPLKKSLYEVKRRLQVGSVLVVFLFTNDDNGKETYIYVFIYSLHKYC